MQRPLPESCLSEWDSHFLRIAETVSLKSRDPSSKIGAIAVSEQNLPLSWGWNGFPRSVPILEDKVSRDIKYKYVVHAEMNAIYNANRESISLRGSSFYIYGIPPCFECAKGLVQIGIQKVITLCYNNINSKWIESYEESMKLFEWAGVKSQVYERSVAYN